MIVNMVAIVIVIITLNPKPLTLNPKWKEQPGPAGELVALLPRPAGRGADACTIRSVSRISIFEF